MTDFNTFSQFRKGWCILRTNLFFCIEHFLDTIGSRKGQLEASPASSHLDNRLVVLLRKLGKHDNQT